MMYHSPQISLLISPKITALNKGLKTCAQGPAADATPENHPTLGINLEAALPSYCAFFPNGAVPYISEK